jgi:hypothetical protein
MAILRNLFHIEDLAPLDNGIGGKIVIMVQKYLLFLLDKLQNIKI